jgi:hypothetical protein
LVISTNLEETVCCFADPGAPIALTDVDPLAFNRSPAPCCIH